MKQIILNFLASIVISFIVFFIVLFFDDVPDTDRVILAMAITISLQLSLITALLLSKHKK
ncbi:hypothetical protein MKX40_07210 [Paenibacillus sp. FSL R5-0517]|uniref:hypothetical protein n=1 Tax=unclassified Paenibacillus TaxID=185978 RepID=UPI0030DC4D23